MRVVSTNLNGIRSSMAKGFQDWVRKTDPDILCMQEIRIQTHQLVGDLIMEGWHYYVYPAHKAGYSGTAILSKRPADSIRRGLGFEVCDAEGRFIVADFAGLKIASLYLPSAYGISQPRKDNFLDEFAARLPDDIHILCGDFNICRHSIDMYAPSEDVSGFLPHEQAWLNELIDSRYIDCWRELNPNKVGYTWWSHRNNAFERNMGWRIDYCLSMIRPVKSYVDVVRFSDHAPVVTDFDL